jgi:hypothetical protein
VQSRVDRKRGFSDKSVYSQNSFRRLQCPQEAEIEVEELFAVLKATGRKALAIIEEIY